MEGSIMTSYLALIYLFFILPASAESIKVTGSLRIRPELWNWYDGSADGSYAYTGGILRLSVGQQKKSFDWQLEFAAPFLLGLPDNSIAPAPQGQLGLGGTYHAANDSRRNAFSVFPKQGYLRFKSLFGNEMQTLRAGRFEFLDGSEATPKDATLAALKRDRINQRLIGAFGWSHVGRSLDGLHYSGAFHGGKTVLTVVSALPTRGAFQTDGWGNLKINMDYVSLTRQYGGANSTGELRGAGIYYHDWRHVLKTDSRALALRQRDLNNIRIGTFGGHWIHKVETQCGSFDGMLYGFGQTGTWGTIAHRASAVNAEAGWQPRVLPKLRPWLRAGYFRGSGDDNPNDSKHGTFFQILPTPRPFARFPFYNMMNNEDRFLNAIVRPHKNWTLRGEFHALRLTNKSDLWYMGGGAYQPWTFGYVGRPTSDARSLANQWDVNVDWNPSARVNVNAYVGYSVGKEVMKRIYPAGSNGSFGYLEVTHKF
jgi:hypothetical protein